MENIHRFTQRARDYAAHRPSYPAALEEWLRSLGPGDAVDLGCGTGIFSRLLASAGWRVTGVEPNAAMASLAQEDFSPVPGTAESTGLPEACADLVTAAQAFHWFDPVASRREMERLLRPGGKILLVWNTRETGNSWGEAYEDLLRRHWPPGEPVSHHRDWDLRRLEEWFLPRRMEHRAFPNPQVMDWETLTGRLASTSYAPLRGTPEWTCLERDLQELFSRFQTEGTILQENTTRVYWG